MTEDLKTCERKRDGLYQQLASLGDFRPGNISVTFSKCGKKKCICRQKGHPGHGPRYLWSTTRKGKSLAQHLRLGPELDQVRQQVEAGRRFQDWYQEVIKTNEQICRLRPVPQIEDENELIGPALFKETGTVKLSSGRKKHLIVRMK